MPYRTSPMTDPVELSLEDVVLDTWLEDTGEYLRIDDSGDYLRIETPAIRPHSPMDPPTANLPWPPTRA